MRRLCERFNRGLDKVVGKRLMGLKWWSPARFFLRGTQSALSEFGVMIRIQPPNNDQLLKSILETF